MRYGVLGPLRVDDGDGREIAIGSGKERLLLARLLLDAGRVVSTDRLVEDLWGDAAPDTVDVAVRVHVSRLRRRLADAGAENVIETRPPGYMLVLRDEDELDAARFADLLARARDAAPGDPETARQLLDQALALSRGDPLEGMEDFAFARDEAVRLEQLRVDAVEQWARASLAAGRVADVVAALPATVARNPTRESLWALHMRALYRAGRQSDALATYERLRRYLAEELGLDPSPEVVRLHAAVLTHAPELDEDARPAPPAAAASLPSGVLTFLLLDIERSTELWQADPDAMWEAHGRFGAIVAEAADRAGGVRPVEQGEGDAALVVFDDAGAAAATALDIHARLAAEPWPTPFPIRVRIGLHTGQASARAGTYQGLVLARAARIRDAGHGGQTLCSAATASALDGKLAGGVVLHDLGRHRLRGITAAEHLYEVRGPGTAEFAPPRAQPEPAHNLPVRLASFVGRERETSDVTRLLAASRLVTLTGPGGVGKTTLALEAGASLAADFADGVWLVELGPVQDAALVPAAVAAAVGAREDAAAELETRLRAHLHDRRALIVLDNCEHLVHAAARVTDAVLGAAPAVRVLATSREPLGVVGEHVLHVAPLPTPAANDEGVEAVVASPAVALFCDRAAAARATFRVGDESAGDVAEIVRRLDGIPLAIELAAARCAAFTPRQILDRLDHRFSLLGGTPAVLPRHQTLRAAIEWSIDLLDETQRTFFRRLSVFAGAFTLDAAESICGAGVPDAAQTLADLVVKSIVVFDAEGDPPRYRLLETVKAFAAEPTTADEQDGLRRRAVAWYVDYAERAAAAVGGVPWRHAGPAAFDRDLDDLRQALAWARSHGEPGAEARLAAALGGYWFGHGHLREGRDILRRALDDPGATPAERARAQFWFAVVAGMGLGDTEAGNAALAESLRTFRQLGDDVWTGNVLFQVAGRTFVAEGPGAAMPVLEECLALYRAGGDRGKVAAALDYLGYMHQCLGDWTVARGLYEEALRVQRERGDDAEVGWELSRLAGLAIGEGDHDAAEQLLDEAHRLVRAAGGDRPLAVVLGYLSDVALARGDVDRARQLGEEVLAIGTRTGNLIATVTGLGTLGRAAAESGEAEEAIRLFVRFLDECRRTGDREGISRGLRSVARVAAGSGQARAAVRLLAAADAIGTSTTVTDGVAAMLRRELGAEYDTLWADGSRLNDGEGVALARSLLPSAVPSADGREQRL